MQNIPLCPEAASIRSEVKNSVTSSAPSTPYFVGLTNQDSVQTIVTIDFVIRSF